MLTRRRLNAHLACLPTAVLLPIKSKASTLAIKKTSNNTLQIDSDNSPMTLTISEPVNFKGTYRVDPRQLARGPVNVVPPEVTFESSPLGIEPHVIPGLWIHHVDTDPARSWHWQCNGMTVDPSRIIEDLDFNTELLVIETLGDCFGARSSSSQKKAIPKPDLLA